MTPAIPHHQLQPGDILRWQCPHFPDNIHRWRVFGVYLGAIGQESLIECESLTHFPGHVEPHDEHRRIFIPEVLVRSLTIEDVGEQFGVSMNEPRNQTTRRRRSRSYWQGVSLHSDASKDALRSWFSPLADDMTPYKGEILCDVDTDREKTLRAFMTDKEGEHYQFIRTRESGGRYTVSMKRIVQERLTQDHQ